MNDSKFPLYVASSPENITDWESVALSITLQGRSFELPSDVPEAVYEYCRDLKVKLSKTAFSAAVDAVGTHFGVPMAPMSVVGSFHQDLIKELQ